MSLLATEPRKKAESMRKMGVKWSSRAMALPNAPFSTQTWTDRSQEGEACRAMWELPARCRVQAEMGVAMSSQRQVKDGAGAGV